MAQEHNSKLISDLYTCTNSKQASSVLDDIDDIGDACFLYPIYDAYKKYKDNDYSYAFLSSIANINSSEVPKVLKEIATDPEIDSIAFVQTLSYLKKYEIFDDYLINRAEAILYRFFSKENVYFYLTDLLDYLNSAKILEKDQDILKLIFEDDFFNKDDRSICLLYFLKIKPKENITYYIENFSLIKDKKAEYILTKEIIGWTGPTSEKLISKIKQDGSIHSKELIQKKEEKVIEKDKQQELKEETEYANAKIVKEIRDIRQKINTLAQTSESFNFVIFPKNDLIIDQIILAKDKNSLMVSCTSLRELILDYSDEFKNHQTKLEDAQKYIDGINANTLNKPLNAIHLYLISKNIKTSKDLFGLKSLNKILSLIGAHQNDSELLEILKNESLLDLYSNEQWDLLHKKILVKYKTSLEKLHTILEIKKSHNN